MGQWNLQGMQSLCSPSDLSVLVQKALVLLELINCLELGWWCTDQYLHLLQHRVVLDPRKQDPHGVRPIVQERNPSSVQLLGQLVDVRLELGKS